MKIKVNIMRKPLFLFFCLLSALSLFSCAKEEFAPNKTPQISNISPLSSTTAQICSESTLISPKVDILLLWDNSSSALFINSSTRNSFNQLIASVSEKFDYHILSAPLISNNTTNSLSEASLVVKDASSVIGVSSILKSKDQAASSLNFSQASGSFESGADRAFSIIQANRSNNIFRNDAYTIIVVMSNGDDTSCEIETGYGGGCSKKDWESRLSLKIGNLLCLRGNTGVRCNGITPLNSTMMRFINIAPLTSCSSGLGKINERYRKIAKSIYEAPYANGWPTSNDNLNPFVSIPDGTPYPDNYNICSIDLNHIFDGVNTAIKQTLIKHVYEFWPVTGSTTSLDPDTIQVTREDGKVLTNRTGEANPTDGYAYIGNQSNHFTRSLPTRGENFTGKMIQLFGVNDNDLIVYPRCLTVKFDAIKNQYGYIQLKNGEPYIPSIVVRINGAIVPQNATNGWDYMGLQFAASLDPSLKIVDSNGSSGYFIRLNGSYKFNNTVGASVPVIVTYTAK